MTRLSQGQLVLSNQGLIGCPAQIPPSPTQKILSKNYTYFQENLKSVENLLLGIYTGKLKFSINYEI